MSEESLWSMLYDLLKRAARSLTDFLVQRITEIVNALSGVDIRVLLVTHD